MASNTLTINLATVAIAIIAYCVFRFFSNIGKEKADRLRQLDKQKSDERKISLEIERIKSISQAVETKNIENIRGYIAVKANFLATANQLFDDLRESGLKNKSRPALKAAEEVAEIKREKKALLTRLKKLESEQIYLADLFPMIYEAREHFLTDTEERYDESDEEFDPVKRFISPEEYKALSSAGRSDLALKNYIARNHTNLEIGRMYERYLGYQYETEGWDVEFKGIIDGYEDLGRDLICRKEGVTEIVQAKNWSSHKEIRENVVFQLYASCIEYSLKNGEKKIKPVLITTTSLSEVAAEIAKRLKIEVRKVQLDKSYPMIKCNTTKDNTSNIYHLPFDQQYDRVKIIPGSKKCYVATAAEAEKLGFRRAYKWKGSSLTTV